MNLYSVDSDEAMKRGDEALNASLLQLLSIVKCFIASALNASLPVLFMEKHSLMLHRRGFLKEIHCLTLHRHYFLFSTYLATSILFSMTVILYRHLCSGKWILSVCTKATDYMIFHYLRFL